MKILEILCLENGDVVLVEAADDATDDISDLSKAPVTQSRRTSDVEKPLVSIRFSPEVRDMLGDDSLGVAEAMIEAATAYISGETGFASGDVSLEPVLESGLDPDLERRLDVRAEQIDPDVDDFDDQVSTAPVVLH